PQAVEDERNLFLARQEELTNQLNILRDQALQREQELQESRASEQQFSQALALAQQQLGVYSGLGAGVVPRVEMLDIQQRVNEYQGQLEQTRSVIGRIEAALAEAHRRSEDQYLQLRAEARRELNER